MPWRIWYVLISSGICSPLTWAADQPSVADTELFEKKIRPVLVSRCYPCHSAASKAVQGGLVLDSREGLRKGGSSGTPGLVEGKPEESLLVQAVRRTGSLKMPPGKALTEEQVKDLEEWVRVGAPDPRVGGWVERPPYDFDKARRFWSFQPVKDVEPPAAGEAWWDDSAIDRFLFAEWVKKGLTPPGRADRRTLLRRVTFDLTGLPPTPDEMAAFLGDRSPDAYANVVERLLASPAYGERWGRHWLDVVRYADTSGCNSDYPVPSAYRYRDYVIRAFQQDKAFDQFLREQLAGDLLPAKDEADRREKTVATGYLALSRRFGSRNNEFYLTIDDTIDNVGKAMLGLSVSCARCHDHKFDPLPTKDYYALYGIFASTKYAFPGTEIYKHPKDFVALGTPEEAARLREWEQALAKTDDRLEELQQEKPGKRTAEQIKADKEAVKARQKQLEAQPPDVVKAYAVADGVPVDGRVFRKGDPKALGDAVPRRFLEVLGGAKVPKSEKGSGRRELAEWVTDPRNPLTARVVVNRVWQWHFGKGIVATPNDFGVRGDAPTHPELLDWLTRRFMEDGWSVKALHRRILLSEAYQAADDDDAANTLKDPKNSLLWRFNRRRLEAEEFRDAVLTTSGALDRTPPGAHPFPPEREWRYTQHRPFVAAYESDHRSVYLLQTRLRKQAYLETFDGADTNATTAVRPVSTTALQGLYLMNDPWLHGQADRLAGRLAGAYGTEAGQIAAAYGLLFQRRPKADEVRDGVGYLRECRAALGEAGTSMEKWERAALGSYLRVLYSSNEFLYVD